MGYQTEFVGEFAVVPPLNADEVAFLRRFAETGHGDDEPSRWCHWEAAECRPDDRVSPLDETRPTGWAAD